MPRSTSKSSQVVLVRSLMLQLGCKFTFPHLGPHSGVAPEDIDSLRAVLPNAELFDSDHLFYLHAAALFHEHSFVGSEVLFTKLALSTIAPGADTSALWLTIIKGSVDLRLYDDAYESLMACPYEKL